MINHKYMSSVFRGCLGNKFAVALLLVAAFFVALSIKLYPDINTGMDFVYVDAKTYPLFPLGVFDCFLWCLIFILLRLSVFFLAKRIQISSIERKFTRKMFICLGVFFFLAWTPYFLAYYPGISFFDEYFVIFDPFAWPIQPLIYSMILHYAWNLGVFFGIDNLGFAFLTIFRMFLMSAAFSYLIFFLYKRGISVVFLAASALVFAFLPIFPNTAITIQKDGIFSLFLLMLTLFLYENKNNLSKIVTKKRMFLIFLCLSLPILLLRNNGLYILVATLMVFGFVERKYMFRFIGAALLFFVITSAANVYRVVPFKESIGIPLQQIGRVLCVGGEISESAKSDLNYVLKLSIWREKYNPIHSDTIKLFNKDFNDELLNANKGRFIKAYLETFSKNISIYFSAHAFATLDFWCIGPWNYHHNQIAFVDAITNDTLNPQNIRWPIERPFHATDFKALKKPVREKIAGFMADNVFYLNGGACGFILLFILALLLEKGENRKAAALLPVFLSYLTILIASPTAFAFRYVLYLAFLMPFILSLPFMSDSGEENQNQS